MALCLFRDITHLNQTEVDVKDSRLTPRGLILQGQEQQVSEEASRKASLEKALLESPAQGHSGRQKRSVDNTGPLEDPTWPQYFRDPCDPNPCQNEGICVNVKGMASCRYAPWPAGGRRESAARGLLMRPKRRSQGRAPTTKAGFDAPELCPESAGRAGVLPGQRSPLSPVS